MSLSLQSWAPVQSKVALLIVGVGRSGTSALSRVINLLGAALPTNLIDPGHGNERGFWEPRRIVELNDEILRTQHSDYYDGRAFPTEWFASAQARAYLDRIAETVEREYQDAPLIVIKDPRICRLAPLYIKALYLAGYATRVVIPLRHPGEMAASMKLRDDADPTAMELIWIRHLLEAESSTRQCPRVWVSYDELLEDWQSLQAKIGSALEIVWPNSIDQVNDQVRCFIEPTFRHFDSRKDWRNGQVGPLAARLWEVAQAGLSGNETTLRQGFDDIRWIIDEVDRLGASRAAEDVTRLTKLTNDVARLSARADADEQTLLQVRNAASEAHDALTAVNTALSKSNAELSQSNAELSKSNSELSATTAELSKRTMELAANAAELTEELSGKMRELAATVAELAQVRHQHSDCSHYLGIVLRSRSWKLTRPLRAVRAALH